MTSSPAVDWMAISEMAQKVGKKVARNWPGIAAEDCAQEALESIWKHPQIADGWPASRGLVESAMTKVANKYASDERYEYMMRSAQYVYTPKDVRSLLEGFWVEDAHSVPDGDDDQISPAADAATGYLDMAAAMKEMPGDDVWRLQRRYRDGEGYPTNAAKLATSKAVSRLTRLMNYSANRATNDGKETVQPFSEVTVRHEAPKAPYQGDTSRPMWDVPPSERQEFMTARNRAV